MRSTSVQRDADHAPMPPAVVMALTTEEVMPRCHPHAPGHLHVMKLERPVRGPHLAPLSLAWAGLWGVCRSSPFWVYAKDNRLCRLCVVAHQGGGAAYPTTRVHTTGLDAAPRGGVPFAMPR